jgi:hypothetical protein
MIRTALNQHPSIRCLGELFNPYSKEETSRPGEASLDRIRRCCPGELDGFCLHAYPRTMWKHGIELTWNAWSALEKADVRIIILQRRDLLRVTASVFLADKRGTYHHSVPTGFHDTITLSPLQVTTAIRDYVDSYAESAERYPDLPVFYYEDICADWLTAVRSIQRQIGVEEPREVWPEFTKSDPRRIRDIIENYDSLYRHFEQSEYIQYFHFAESSAQPVVPQKSLKD